MTLNEAKELFFSYDCSTFSIAREDLEQYNEYLNLNIDKTIENEWRKEKLICFSELINMNSHDESISALFVKMYRLVENLKTSESIDIIQKSYNSIKNNLSEKEKIIIAETIIGRKHPSCRSGLIYLAYDINEKRKSKDFVNDTFNLISVNFHDEDLKRRAEVILKTCTNISNELSEI